MRKLCVALLCSALGACATSGTPAEAPGRTVARVDDQRGPVDSSIEKERTQEQKRLTPAQLGPTTPESAGTAQPEQTIAPPALLP